MRFSFLAALPLLGAVALTPSRGSAQISATIHLGTPIAVTHYSADVHGDWHANYRKWNVVTLYSYDGHFYSHNVRGAHPVQVYRSGTQYFTPPQDQAWVNHGDKRYNYQRRPNDDDYSHATEPVHHL